MSRDVVPSPPPPSPLPSNTHPTTSTLCMHCLTFAAGILCLLLCPCRALDLPFFQGLEGSPAHLQAAVRSTFSGILHTLVRVLERCFTSTGDIALANAVMWSTALDFEHGDHDMVLDSRLLPVLGKVGSCPSCPSPPVAPRQHIPTPTHTHANTHPRQHLCSSLPCTLEPLSHPASSSVPARWTQGAGGAVSFGAWRPYTSSHAHACPRACLASFCSCRLV